MAGKYETPWYDNLLMAVSRRSNDFAAAAADLADRYGVSPANSAAWFAQHLGGYSPQEAANIGRTLKRIGLGSFRDMVTSGARTNEDRFRRQGGTGARKAEEVTPPVRLGAVVHRLGAVPQAVVRVAPDALRTTRDYFATNTPSGVLSDIGNLIQSGYEGVKKDPYGAVVNTLLYGGPQTAAAASAFDLAAMREASQSLDPYVKEDKEAAKAQDMVDAISVLPPLAVVPAAGAVVRKVRRKRGGPVNKKGKK